MVAKTVALSETGLMENGLKIRVTINSSSKECFISFEQDKGVKIKSRVKNSTCSSVCSSINYIFLPSRNNKS